MFLLNTGCRHIVDGNGVPLCLIHHSNAQGLSGVVTLLFSQVADPREAQTPGFRRRKKNRYGIFFLNDPI